MYEGTLLSRGESSFPPSVLWPFWMTRKPRHRNYSVNAQRTSRRCTESKIGPRLHCKLFTQLIRSEVNRTSTNIRHSTTVSRRKAIKLRSQ